MRHYGKVLTLALGIASAGCAAGPRTAPSVPVDRDAAKRAVARALDELHLAAAQADESRYFARFASDGVFLGTDASERWDVSAFRTYAHPHFAARKAWSFHATRRAITLATDATLAWFDEDLATEKLGPARGSGVLRLVAGEWKVEQYNLTTVVPNARFAAVRAAIDGVAASALPSFQERFGAAHARALADAKRGDFKEAERTLRSLAAEAEAGELHFEAIGLRDELAWLRWSERDLSGAYAEIDALESVASRLGLIGNLSRQIHIDAERSRAFLLREMAVAAPPTLRAEALAAASSARAKHAEDATSIGHQQSVAVIAALFAVRAGDARGAVGAATGIQGGEENDWLASYVLALAYDLAQDRARAEATRATIRAAPDDLKKLAVLRRIEADARPNGG